MKFEIISKDKKSKARAGKLSLKHGVVETPYYMPVATKATIKMLDIEDVKELGASLLMTNTYHLMLRPGVEIVKEFNGLHKFMNWDRCLMTDSGGFQAFSLGFGMEHLTGKVYSYFPDEDEIERNAPKVRVPKFAHVDDTGVEFKTDSGKVIKLTPKKSIKLQEGLGADMIIAFDECTSPMSDYEYTKESMERTHRWAKECLKVHKTDQALFGVIQGGAFEDLRRESTKFISSLPFDGICIGGFLGKSKKEMHKILNLVVEELPENKPRHLLGIGTVEDFFEGVERGVDLFDCVGPTMIARTGYVFICPESGGKKSNKFRFKVSKIEYKKDKLPLDPKCGCKVCKNYSRAYINHLFKAKEYTGMILTTYHNLYFMLNLMKEIRESIKKGNFSRLKKKWL